MATASDSLLREGLAALGEILPDGYRLAKSSVRNREVPADAWILVRNPAKQSVTCLVVARRRVETRDLGAIATSVARAPNPALLVSTYLAPVVKERLRGFGIGFWDLAGGAGIVLQDIGLRIERDGAAGVSGNSEHAVRSLCGEMSGRVARALVDVRPPYPLGVLAEHAHVPRATPRAWWLFSATPGSCNASPAAGLNKSPGRRFCDAGRWIHPRRRGASRPRSPTPGEFPISSRGSAQAVFSMR